MAYLVRTLVLVPAVFLGLPVLAASASTGPVSPIVEPATDRAAAQTDPLQLAQYGDVEIYIDEYGRRIIVDAYTGEVLGIERPRVNRNRERRAQRLRELGREPEFGADGIPYKRRGELPVKRRHRPFTVYPDDIEPVPEAPEYAYPEAPEEVFPEPPRASNPAEPEEPEVAARQPIERQPLDPAQSEMTPPPASDEELTTGTTPSVIDGGAPSDPPGATIEPGKQPSITFGARDDVAALQILLDRKGASPGVIDGHFGGNVDKALAGFRDITGLSLRSIDTIKIKEELAATGGDAFIRYTITPEDAAGPYVASVPADYGKKAKLERLSYTSVSEMLAERFHMDENYLKALNPDAVFGRPGTVIKVANIGTEATRLVARIVADKRQKQVRAYDEAGKLVVIYPATIGSEDTPSPSGRHKIERVAFNPEYTYNPNLNFKQGDNNKVLTIPPGPNGPVGSIWIALDKPTYGIHGTPDPSKIGKTESHGCVRLTNWDATELAKLVKPGVMVEFLD